MKLIKFFNGKKAILTGVASICTGSVMALNGDVKTGVELILGGLSVIFLRTGMNK